MESDEEIGTIADEFTDPDKSFDDSQDEEIKQNNC